MARILIVDDSPTDIQVLKTFVERHGHQSIPAVDGEQAMKKARDERPDLILMDVVLPGMSGFQATRQLSKNPETASIPIIIVTTKGQETDRVWGLRQGAKDYITKPVLEENLIAKIRAALGE